MYKRIFKRIIDFILSSIMILLLAPFFVIIYLFVKLDSSGPFFFFQKRLGKGGETIEVYKIRTMTNIPRVANREILKGDIEVTRVGGILRRLKIDELPQLINVWKGEMSFVGPRPSLPNQKNSFNEDGKKRILVRPGLTGLAQVNGNIYLSWEERWKFDRMYVEKLSFILDFKIVVKTILVVLFGEKKYLNKPKMYNILVIGAVSSTAVILNKLKEHSFNIVGVLGHEPNNINNVSGWFDLKSLSSKLDVDYYGFKKINDAECIKWAESKKPDIIFAVGFSQLMSSVWLQMPTLGCIGFHPTKLPEGRGRAPLAWITLEKNIGSATFFLMGEGADDGPIFSQSLFEVNNSDDAASVGLKIEQHIHMALDKWLPNLKNGIWEPIPQEEALATWYGVRKPEDGCIEWSGSASYIDRLIKATTFPHPGAYTYFKDEKVIILESTKETHIPIKGVVGRILLKDKEKGCLIQCGDGLLWINNLIFESDKIQLKVGNKLGYNIQDEIYLIKKHLKNE